MFKKKYLLLTLFLITIFQILLYTNNNQKTSFRYFKWTVQEVSIGKLISISFFSGLFVSTLLNTTITSTSFRKKTFENVEDDFVSNNNEEEMEPNIEMPPQRDIRETQPTISVNYRVVKNMNENNLKTKKLINFGPSGRAVAQPIDNSLLDNIFEHLTMERYANVQYFSIYLWFQERDLNGFASHFLSESQGEMEHAQKFADYLIARGQSVKLDEIPAPVQEWDSIEDLISYSFNMEADLTSSLQQLYSISERISDTRTNVFLDPIIEAQTKSEDEFANILGKVRFASNQPSAILLIDSDLKKK